MRKHSFSRAPMRNSFWCYYRWFITSLTLEKCKKNAICFKLFWYKIFVHWKSKLLNVLVDSVLNSWWLLKVRLSVVVFSVFLPTSTIFCEYFYYKELVRETYPDEMSPKTFRFPKISRNQIDNPSLEGSHLPKHIWTLHVSSTKGEFRSLSLVEHTSRGKKWKNLW